MSQLRGGVITGIAASVVCLLLFPTLLLAQPTPSAFDLDISTYLGGSGEDIGRDVVVDAAGNIYVTGGTKSTNFPTTAGVYDRTFNTGGTSTGAFGERDIFVTKYDAAGNLLWSTYLGGPNYDLAFGMEVDSQGYIYLAGQAGENFPMKNAIQPQFNGAILTGYGLAGTFVAKLEPDGSDLVWSTYFGNGRLARDMDIDANGDVYVTVENRAAGTPLPSQWFTGSYQDSPPGNTDLVVAKIRSDGTDAVWATYLGGPNDEARVASTRVNSQGFVYIAAGAIGSGMPLKNAFDSTFGGGTEYYVAKIEADGTDIVYATYVGGSGDEFLSTHNLEVDNAGIAYVGLFTSSSDLQTTSGAYQTQACSGGNCQAVVKLSSTGALLASTYIGGSSGQNLDGINLDGVGNVYITGETPSSDYPVTANAYQGTKGSGRDAFFSVLSADLTTLLYSTFLGGNGEDTARSSTIDANGSAYLTGVTGSSNLPTVNAQQPTSAGGDDVLLSRFVVSTSAVCGNSATESGEECDDGNASSGDCCSSTCQFEDLGNDTCGVGECFNTEPVCISGSANTCTPLAPPETNELTCADGKDNDCDGAADQADSDCVLCGDGFCVSPETAVTCPADCPPVCGDGACQAGEACPADCCGNSSLDSGEECDDGNARNGDCCDSVCQFVAGPPDLDTDGVEDSCDTCPMVHNPTQAAAVCDPDTLFNAANFDQSGFSASRIDGRDLFPFSRQFGLCPIDNGYDARFNLDQDPGGCITGALDLLIFLDQFGRIN